MNARRLHFSLALAIALLAVVGTLTLLGALGGGSLMAQAQPGTGVIRVATTGSDAPDCGEETNPCRTVQYAVDQALPGEEIRVAAGTYTGVQNVPALNTSNFTATQVVAIIKSVTIRGGYTTADWSASNPDANHTTLDAEGSGRALVIIGEVITPIVEGLCITGGDATGLGRHSGGVTSIDAGGGVYVSQASAAISNCEIYSNTASVVNSGYGGGMYLCWDEATLEGNIIMGNTASSGTRGRGGGLYLNGSGAMLEGNTVMGNTAGTKHGMNHGGGVYLSYGDATLKSNTIISNVASTVSGAWAYGGGLYLNESAATLEGNVIVGNVASTAARGHGGGLRLIYSDATLKGNTVIGNTASTAGFGYGGGLYVQHGDPVLINNLLADNHADIEGSGLWFDGASWALTTGRLLHNTIADNHGVGQGIYVKDYTTLAFTNTIIAGHHSVGITVTTGSTATLEATLWYDNGSDAGGEGNISTGTVNVYGDPAFINPAGGDYHIGVTSAAIDAGVDAGVMLDIDGQVRPWANGFDIGADEYGSTLPTPTPTSTPTPTLTPTHTPTPTPTSTHTPTSTPTSTPAPTSTSTPTPTATATTPTPTPTGGPAYEIYLPLVLKDYGL